MGKQVPLVVYIRGTRTEVGKAIVYDDGSIEAQVAKDHWPLVNTIFHLVQPSEFSIGTNETVIAPLISPKI